MFVGGGPDCWSAGLPDATRCEDDCDAQYDRIIHVDIVCIGNAPHLYSHHSIAFVGGGDELRYQCLMLAIHGGLRAVDAATVREVSHPLQSELTQGQGFECSDGSPSEGESAILVFWRSLLHCDLSIEREQTVAESEEIPSASRSIQRKSTLDVEATAARALAVTAIQRRSAARSVDRAVSDLESNTPDGSLGGPPLQGDRPSVIHPGDVRARQARASHV